MSYTGTLFLPYVAPAAPYLFAYDHVANVSFVINKNGLAAKFTDKAVLVTSSDAFPQGQQPPSYTAFYSALGRLYASFNTRVGYITFVNDSTQQTTSLRGATATTSTAV